MRVVVTGGPGSGKSTLVAALGRRGFATVEEAAIQVIAELNAERGVEGQKAWRRAHKSEFQELVARRQAALEEAVPEDTAVLFLDRGRLDGLAYCRHFGADVPLVVAEVADAARYDRVLMLDTLPDEVFADRGASGRTSGRAASLAIGAAIEAVYRERGYEPVRLPVAQIEERAEIALGLLGLG